MTIDQYQSEVESLTARLFWDIYSQDLTEEQYDRLTSFHDALSESLNVLTEQPLSCQTISFPTYNHVNARKRD